MAKPKNLSNIKIKEVSYVDLPANKQSFLFFKRKGDVQIDSINKATEIEIGIVSDGTVGGTKITINGDDMEDLRSFDFSFYGEDPESTVHASYSKVTEEVDGFSRTETYYLSKGEMMDKKTLKALQVYLGTDEIDFEKKVDEEEIQKALNLISEHYQESFPEDLENAVGIIAKRAAHSYAAKSGKDVEKAGARFSKDVIAKLKAIIAAVEALKGILPDVKPKEKSDSGGSEELAELSKQVTQLTEAVAKLDPKKKADDKSNVAELTKTLKEVSERVKSMEKDGAQKKSITGDDGDDDVSKGAGDDGKVLWPSFQPNQD